MSDWSDAGAFDWGDFGPGDQGNPYDTGTTSGMPAGSPDLIQGSPVAPGGPGDPSGPGFSLSDIAGLLKSFPGGLTGLLGVLGPVLGGVYAKTQTNKANQQMQDAIKAANAQVNTTLGGNAAIYAPYQAAGQVGLQRLQNLPQSNLASQYRPLGTGAGLSLANVARGR